MLKVCLVCGKIHENSCKKKRRYWRDNRSKVYKDFIRSKDWQELAKEVKRLDGFECLVCKSLGLESPCYLEVHHIVKVNDDITQGLNCCNLISLCIIHHKQAENKIINKDELNELIRRYRKEKNEINFILF